MTVLFPKSWLYAPDQAFSTGLFSLLPVDSARTLPAYFRSSSVLPGTSRSQSSLGRKSERAPAPFPAAGGASRPHKCEFPTGRGYRCEGVKEEQLACVHGGHHVECVAAKQEINERFFRNAFSAQPLIQGCVPMEGGLIARKTFCLLADGGRNDLMGAIRLR